MRFGIDCREFQAPGQTGIARILSGLIEWVPSNRPDITLVLFLNQRCRFVSGDPRVEPVVIQEKNTLAWDQIHLPREIKRGRVDVFLSPYVKVPFMARCPVVMIVHDLIPIMLPEDDRSAVGNIKGAYLKLLLSRSMRKAARIITVSEYTRREFVQVMGADESKITVVYNGLSGDLKPVKSPERIGEAARRAGVEGQYIFYLGHLRASKNVGSLIAAYSMLPAGMREEYSLLIGGNKTGKYSSLEKMVGELGMEGKVIFPGYISDEDAAALMAGAAVFVYPSKYEGFGYPPLEAMALGAPVICSTATSLGEVVGDAAIGVEPEPEPIAVAIEKVLSDPELRRSLIEKGAVRAKEFTTDIMARKYVEIMESLAGPS